MRSSSYLSAVISNKKKKSHSLRRHTLYNYYLPSTLYLRSITQKNQLKFTCTSRPSIVLSVRTRTIRVAVVQDGGRESTRVAGAGERSWSGETRWRHCRHWGGRAQVSPCFYANRTIISRTRPLPSASLDAGDAIHPDLVLQRGAICSRGQP